MSKRTDIRVGLVFGEPPWTMEVIEQRGPTTYLVRMVDRVHPLPPLKVDRWEMSKHRINELRAYYRLTPEERKKQQRINWSYR